MRNFIRNHLRNLLIKLTEKDISFQGQLTEEQLNGLLAGLWDNPSFRKYVSDRNSKLIYSIAGIAGEEPEPRVKTLMKHGQRVEILLLAAKAKACSLKRDREREAKKVEQP